MDEYIYRKSAEFKLYEAFITDAKSFKKAITALKEIPLVDVQHVVHGHWIVQRSNYNEKFECSVCQHISKDGGNYCSNCGARMVTDDERTD